MRSNRLILFAVAIRAGAVPVRRVWFAVRAAVGMFLAIVREMFVFFDSCGLTLVEQR